MLRVRSPLVTAVATSAMARTCVVRFAASWLTLSVRSRHVPGGARHVRLTAELSFDADLARHRRDLIGEGRQRVDHVVDRVGQLGDLAARFDGQLLLQVAAARPRSRPWRCRAPDWSGSTAIMLTLSVRSFHVPATPLHLRLAAELPFRADLARHARDLGRERVELIDHRVDRCSSARGSRP